MNLTVNGQEFTDEKTAKKYLAKVAKEEKQAEKDKAMAWVSARRQGELSLVRILWLIDRELIGRHITTDFTVKENSSGGVSREYYPVGGGGGEFFHGVGRPQALCRTDGDLDLAVKWENEWFSIGADGTTIALVPIPAFIAKMLDDSYQTQGEEVTA